MGKIVAIDGPAGAGKSTVAKKVAARLGYTYIDTGAMYRAVGLKVSEREKNFSEEILKEVTEKIEIESDETGKIFANGEDVTKKIRTPEIGKFASDVSKFPFVRKKLMELQRKMAETKSVVMEGRDIGTEVFPNADFKIFLTADVSERARRRFEELREKNIAANLDEIEKDIAARDKQDSERKIAPLKKADDAILIDSTNLAIDEVTEKILSIVQKNSDR